MAKIDVLIPTFNRGVMLREAVQSILNQTMQDFRIIIWDDGSTDGSTEKEALPDDPRILVLNKGEENRGIAHARSQLLKQVEAPFAAWQDSDDISDPKRLEVMLKHLEDTGADFAFSYLYFFNGNVKRKHWHLHKVDTARYKALKDGGPEHYGLKNNMNHPTAVFKASVTQYPVQPNGRSFGTDFLWVKSLLDSGVTFSHVSEPLYFLRRHSERVTGIRRVKGKSNE